MLDWREMRVEGLGPISKVAAIFQVGAPLERLPFSSFKIKVLERRDGSFLAVPNVSALGADGHPSWDAGLGDTIDQALGDALERFARLLEELKPSNETDFSWADPTEF
ncbi:hypothetical protein [Paludisphaera soli]|uniref:hypothetical protein n=1 Tax=Paludisphaera soli TaxID=2712865 RepID=UPI0013ED83A4|nr:hypothetical protein [Paludisphaera soli]